MMTPRAPALAGPTESAAHTSRKGDLAFWVSAGIGALLMGYGVLLLVAEPTQTVPFATVRRLATILLLHDLVLLPLVFGFATAVLRWVPRPWLPPIRFALFVSAMVILVAIWGLAGQAIEVQPGNDQVLPNDYPKSVALLLTPVWLISLVWGWKAQLRNREAAGATAGEEEEERS